MFRQEGDTVTFEGIPYPAHFLENQNVEALASLPSTQWNPGSCAYFGFIRVFVFFSRETVSHTHVASVQSAIIPCPLPAARVENMIQLREMTENGAVRVSFQKQSLFTCADALLVSAPVPGNKRI